MQQQYRHAVFALIGAAASALSTAAAAQPGPAYPARPVRLIVSFPPGGGTDIIARTLGKSMAEGLGQPMVIDNRGGAGGNLGAEIAAKAAPDGYTLFIGAGTHAINMTLYEKPGYDLVKDFTPVTPVASIPYTLVSNTTVAARSIQDLVKLAKDKPGQLNYASAGSGTGTHLAMEILKSSAGINIGHVPYRGSAPAVTELVGGQVQVMFGNTAAVLPQIKAGRLRALAISSASRLPLLPDVPTIAETIVPKFEVIQWYGVLAPAGTPQAIVQHLNTAVGKVSQSPEFRERVALEGGSVVRAEPAQFAGFIKSEVAQWAKAVRGSGARVD